MADMSALDSKYFVDGGKYNCPYCRRRHVVYGITSHRDFDWTESKRCRVVFVQCASCRKESMHLSFVIDELLSARTGAWRFASTDIDEDIFYSVPTSTFALDARIPRELRELLTEAEGCLKSNFLTGASACARKIVYELAKEYKAEGDNYEDRIKSLKSRLPKVDEAFFDTLATIQEVTSGKVHENSYEGWESRHLRVILAALVEVLQEVYVVPALRADRRKAVLDLKSELLPTKAPEAD